LESCPDKLIGLATGLADAVRPISMSYFRTPVEAKVKNDKSPVTVADKKAEAKMREMIEAEYPDHGIFGEEYGVVRTDAEFVWVLDPIDGTKSFLVGKPLFGTLIGLLHKGRAVLGIIDMPALGERWTGAKGHPTTFNGENVTTRACEDLSKAWMLVTSPDMFLGDDKPAFKRLKRQVKFLRWGTDCMGYGLLASGYADVVCEAKMSPYDYVALVPVVEGAGGVMTDWHGNPLGLENDGTVLASGDKRLHGPAIATLKG
jgi:inositol-phosphate phosphatase/L-galactose 1-phosphate phosphatase/histidinol-phosphatase